MKRLYFVAGATLALLALFVFSALVDPYDSAALASVLPDALPYIRLSVIVVSFAVGVAAFDLVASGLRWSVVQSAGSHYIVAIRSFVLRLMRLPSEVRRQRIGSAGGFRV